MRDYALGVTFDLKFSTRNFSTGAPFTLAGSPVISAYVDNNTTEITAGITLSVDFDGRTGLNNIRVVATSGNGYASGANYSLVITTGTVNGVSVVGEVVGEFSLEAQSPLRPTTAGRTLDVTAGGEAGLDWANIGSPTTAQNLSATNIDVDQVVASVTNGATAAALATAQTSIDVIDGIVDDILIDTGTTLPGQVATMPAAVWATDVSSSISPSAGYQVYTARTTATEILARIGAFTKTGVNTIFGFLKAALSKTATTPSDVGGTFSAADDSTEAIRDAMVTTAQVNAEVLDVLNVDTFAEPAAVPAATASLVAKIGWLMALARNKLLQTSTLFSLRNDADSGNIGTAAVADDGSQFTRSEFT